MCYRSEGTFSGDDTFKLLVVALWSTAVYIFKHYSLISKQNTGKTGVRIIGVFRPVFPELVEEITLRSMIKTAAASIRFTSNKERSPTKDRKHLGFTQTIEDSLYL
ncbi:hypothetical protein PICMEDRAFT_64537 [Pichia membranifaciens NRRL Y-2026]|uniref:Uncharacterized protein n=1 Tax=Pichia membranifaciens NRRL Y-2026 TaxID=763406 RepID=A0A1E3NFJ5_9ASCO|nr:hypothetical protein PICMEDRAFT_64537 [Pichia membranifaciens NRRL Y-2026]ODQ44866.1 hypothetical protein PICMEDRAFT_64537 [Pichia membranifaciens NRRL Y-2026]